LQQHCVWLSSYSTALVLKNTLSWSSSPELSGSAPELSGSSPELSGSAPGSGSTPELSGSAPELY